MADEGDTTRAHLWIEGRVQGVFFRASTRKKAQKLGVDGWVRNLPDGRVEAVFEGKQGEVNKAISWCNRGPRSARVEDVDLSWEEPQGESGFRVVY